jgi:hypothetical protein
MDWTDITDVRITDEDGNVLYEGPKFLRCYYNECLSIVTQGQINLHGRCASCGGRKFRQTVLLKQNEIMDLSSGKHVLAQWEKEMIDGSIKELPAPVEKEQNDD